MEEESKSRNERTIRVVEAIVTGVAVGVAIGAITILKAKTKQLNNLEEDLKMWNCLRINPESLQAMIDKPDTVVAFESARTFVGNTTSSEA